MKILIIYVALIAAFYFIDQQLDMTFIESKSKPDDKKCEERNATNGTIHCCGYIWYSNENMVTFFYKSLNPLQLTELMLFYQPFAASEKLNLTELMDEDANSTFPFINANEKGQEELDKHNLKELDYEEKIGKSEDHYIMTTEQNVVTTYVLFSKGLDVNTIEMYYKNNLKFLEDSFVTFLCFVIMVVALRLINEDEDDLIPLGHYIKQNQPHMLLMIVLIAQPLRPLCYFPEFEAIEWLIGQFCYAVGEFLFLRYFLQVISYLKGQNNTTNQIRNTLVSIFVIVPICLDRLIIAFDSQSSVIKNIGDQVNYIDSIMRVCWISFLLYSSVFAYEIMMSLQSRITRSDLFLVDILFFVVYAFQKSHFYLYYENYSHHLFNPVNMLMMVSYIAILLTLDLHKSSEKEQEMTEIHHQQVDQDEEHGDNLESTIAEYYKEKPDEQGLI